MVWMYMYLHMEYLACITLCPNCQRCTGRPSFQFRNKLLACPTHKQTSSCQSAMWVCRWCAQPCKGSSTIPGRCCSGWS